MGDHRNRRSSLPIVASYGWIFLCFTAMGLIGSILLSVFDVPLTNLKLAGVLLIAIPIVTFIFLMFYLYITFQVIKDGNENITGGQLTMLWMCVSIVMIHMFALLHFSLVDGTGLGNGVSSDNAIYFSFVTWTSLGYGDVLPQTLEGRVVASIEALVGIVSMGILSALLCRESLVDKISLLAVFIVSALLICFFGCIFSSPEAMLGVEDESWFTPYYFSMVTWASLGYGDISPSSDYQYWSVAEVCIGYFATALLISKFMMFIKSK